MTNIIGDSDWTTEVRCCLIGKGKVENVRSALKVLFREQLRGPSISSSQSHDSIFPVSANCKEVRSSLVPWTSNQPTYGLCQSQQCISPSILRLFFWQVQHPEWLIIPFSSIQFQPYFLSKAYSKSANCSFLKLSDHPNIFWHLTRLPPYHSGLPWAFVSILQALDCQPFPLPFGCQITSCSFST